MIVDCGGSTVNLTVRNLLGNSQLGEVTEYSCDYYGSTFIDEEFINFLRKKFGDSAIDSFRNDHYDQFQYMIQNFCENAKIPFTGDDLDFLYELDIEEVAPILLQYVGDEITETKEDNDWIIKINYEYIKAMFDPVINRIVKLIYSQLSNTREKYSVILVGGFSESKYLQQRIKQEFQHRVKNISVPTNPIAAISRGAVMYGSSLKMYGSSINNNLKGFVINTRVLKFTYGIKIRNYWVSLFLLN
jgi:molecular chaperone DnaK (HSP70)